MNYISNINFSYCIGDDGKMYMDNKLGIIHIVDFDEGSLCQFVDGYTNAINSRSNILPIEIDSYGGEVDVLNGMLSYIDDFKASDGIVMTYCGSKAMSCGSVLLSSGSKGYRFMSPRAHLMIHEVSGIEFGKLNDVKNGVKHQELLNKKLFKQLDENAGKPEGYFSELCSKNKNADLFLDAEQCLEHGLIDFIGLPTLSLSVDPTYEIILPSTVKTNELQKAL
jgi:ATP-dependent protease ClpP protease subunit